MKPIEDTEILPETLSLPALGAYETSRLEELVAAVSEERRTAFESSYEAWQRTWGTFPAGLDSSGLALTLSVEFVDLLRTAADTLPLLMEKLGDPEQHFALLVAEQILPASAVAVFDEDDPLVLEGEQFRARITLSNWLLAD